MHLRPFWSHTAVTCFIISRQSSCFLTCIKSLQLLSSVSRCTKSNAEVDSGKKWQKFSFSHNVKKIFLLEADFLLVSRRRFGGQGQRKEKKKRQADKKSEECCTFFERGHCFYMISFSPHFKCDSELNYVFWEDEHIIRGQRVEGQTGRNSRPFWAMSVHMSFGFMFCEKGSALQFWYQQ